MTESMQAEQYELLFDRAVSYMRTKGKNANLTDEQKLNIYNSIIHIFRL